MLEHQQRKQSKIHKNMFKNHFFFAFLLGYFVLPSYIFAQKSTFENFAKKFPVANLPFKIDRKIIDKGFAGLKPITPNEVETFLLQKASDTNTRAFFQDKKTEKQLVAQKKVLFFAVNKININEDFTSLLVYRFDKSIKKGYGVLSYDFFIFNFDKKNTLINTISIAEEEYFMSARFHEGFLEKNREGEVILKIVETDYNEFDRAKQTKSNYEANTYYLLTKKMTVENVNERYYPYLGTFSWNNDEISIDQNKTIFMVMRGQKGSGGQTGQELITHNLQKGTFTIKTLDMGIVQGEFNADKTEIKITKADKTVLIYKKTNKW